MYDFCTVATKGKLFWPLLDRMNPDRCEAYIIGYIQSIHCHKCWELEYGEAVTVSNNS